MSLQRIGQGNCKSSCHADLTGTIQRLYALPLSSGSRGFLMPCDVVKSRAVAARAAAGVCALMFAAPIAGQAPVASVAGVVLDPDAKVVVNAAVIVRDESTNEIRTTATDGVGHFSVTGLAPGIYTVEIAAPGLEIV